MLSIQVLLRVRRESSVSLFIKKYIYIFRVLVKLDPAFTVLGKSICVFKVKVEVELRLW